MKNTFETSHIYNNDVHTCGFRKYEVFIKQFLYTTGVNKIRENNVTAVCWNVPTQYN